MTYWKEGYSEILFTVLRIKLIVSHSSFDPNTSYIVEKKLVIINTDNYMRLGICNCLPFL